MLVMFEKRIETSTLRFEIEEIKEKRAYQWGPIR